MRAGGGKAKGSNYEREVCKVLSLWLSDGAQSDLFTRNILSGGAYTRRHSDRGMPGDLAASHPLSHAFLERYFIECKHHRNLGLGDFLYHGMQRTAFGKIVGKCIEQSADAKRYYLIVAKQNNRDALVFLPRTPGDLLTVRLRKQSRVRVLYHALHGGNVFCMRLSDFVAFVPPDAMMQIPYIAE